MHLSEAVLLGGEPPVTPHGILEADMPRTPSQWSPSIRGSPTLVSRDVHLSDHRDIPALEEDEDVPVQDNGHAEFEGTDNTDERPDAHYALLASRDVQRNDENPEDESHGYAESMSRDANDEGSLRNPPLILTSASQTKILPPPSFSHFICQPITATGRIPIPRRALHDVDSRQNHEKFGRILVPDSDTSATLSQGLGPQSQSLSYGSQKSNQHIQLQPSSLPRTSYNSDTKPQSSHLSQQSLSYTSDPHSQSAAQFQNGAHTQSQLQNEVKLGTEEAQIPARDEPLDVVEQAGMMEVDDQVHGHHELVGSAGVGPTHQKEGVPTPLSDSDAIAQNQDKDMRFEVSFFYRVYEIDCSDDIRTRQITTIEPLNQPTLDEDDMRLKQIVDTYISVLGTMADISTMSPAVLEPSQLPKSTSPEAHYIPASPSKNTGSFSDPLDILSNGPAYPLTPDVFLSEDSFYSSAHHNTSPSQSSPLVFKRSSQNPRGASNGMKGGKLNLNSQSSQTAARKKPLPSSYHDPKVWAEPSFKSMTSPSNTSGSAMDRKRPISASSSSSGIPVKRRKTLKPLKSNEESIPRTSTQISDTRKIIDNSKKREPSLVIISPRTEARSSHQNDRMTRQRVDPSGGDPASAASRAPDVTSHATTQQQQQKAHNESNQFRGQRDRMRTQRRTEAPTGTHKLPSLKAKAGLNGQQTSAPGTSRNASSASRSHVPKSTSPVPHDPTTVGKRTKAKPSDTSTSILNEPNKTGQLPWLGGYRTRAHIPVDDGGPMITGEDALKMLLRTGRTRYKERREAEEFKGKTTQYRQSTK